MRSPKDEASKSYPVDADKQAPIVYHKHAYVLFSAARKHCNVFKALMEAIKAHSSSRTAMRLMTHAGHRQNM